MTKAPAGTRQITSYPTVYIVNSSRGRTQWSLKAVVTFKNGHVTVYASKYRRELEDFVRGLGNVVRVTWFPYRGEMYQSADEPINEGGRNA